MKLTIVAATGGIGRHVLDQAVAAGHDVTVVVRNPKKVSQQVRVVVADLAGADSVALEPAVAGADAVLSGLGARSKAEAEAGVAWRGTDAVVRAMHATGARRIIVVSAAPIGTMPWSGRPNPPKHDPGDGFLNRYVFTPTIKRVLRAHYTDLAHMEDLLRDSGLEWTIVRPPRLTDKPLTGRYRTAVGRNIRGGLTVSRADVAHYLLHAVDQPDSVGQTIGIAAG